MFTLAKSRINKLQKVQDRAVRWIYNEPRGCPLDLRHAQLKLESLEERIKRMAENIWSKIEDEDGDFFRDTIAIDMIDPHNRYPSSYEATFN